MHTKGNLQKPFEASATPHRLISLCQELFDVLAKLFKQNNPHQSYLVDTLALAVCEKACASAALALILYKSTAARLLAANSEQRSR
jgi:hypothetical protein